MATAPEVFIFWVATSSVTVAMANCSKVRIRKKV